MPEDGERDNGELDLDMSELSPKEALQGFMEVDPEKVKERIEGESDGGEDEPE